MAMPPTRRHNRRISNDPETLAARLPNDLRSFDRWHYSDGGTPIGLMKDYLAAVTDQLGEHGHLAVPVMNAAGLSVADWYRTALTSPDAARVSAHHAGFPLSSLNGEEQPA